MCAETGVAGQRVTVDLQPVLCRRLIAFGCADTERREVVEEEVVQMIVGDDDDAVRLSPCDFGAELLELVVDGCAILRADRIRKVQHDGSVAGGEHSDEVSHVPPPLRWRAATQGTSLRRCAARGSGLAADTDWRPRDTSHRSRCRAPAPSLRAAAESLSCTRRDRG